MLTGRVFIIWPTFSNDLVVCVCPLDVETKTEVSALSPRVAFLDHQRSVLTVGNSHLRQRIAALAQDKIFKDGEFPRLISPEFG